MIRVLMFQCIHLTRGRSRFDSEQRDPRHRVENSTPHSGTTGYVSTQKKTRIKIKNRYYHQTLQEITRKVNALGACVILPLEKELRNQCP